MLLTLENKSQKKDSAPDNSLLIGNVSNDETKSPCARKSCILLWVCFAAVTALTLGAVLVVYKEESRRALAPVARTAAPADPVVSCYYNTPGPAAGARQLLPSDLHPFLCTHINVAFARVLNKSIHLDDHQYAALRQIVQLKKINPKLKILISVGGAGNNDGFPEMVADHASRKVFIRSLKSLLRNYTLDGLDLDWEFPAVQSSSSLVTLGKRQRQHFSQLLREIRMEYIREKRNYLLTVAAAAPQIIVDAAYDVDQLDLYTDFVNIMMYDYHFFTDITPFTGLNAPLYALPDEGLYMATLNINYTVHLYNSKGLSLNKIVVGIPTYAHTFKLFNKNNHVIGSPALGYGEVGSSGFANYPDVCEFINKHENNTVVKYTAAKVPYLYCDQEWISFDSPKSVSEKAAYIKRLGLGGAMIYSLNADDYEGTCKPNLGGSVKFPLSQTVKNILLSDANDLLLPS